VKLRGPPALPRPSALKTTRALITFIREFNFPHVIINLPRYIQRYPQQRAQLMIEVERTLAKR